MYNFTIKYYVLFNNNKFNVNFPGAFLRHTFSRGGFLRFSFDSEICHNL